MTRARLAGLVLVIAAAGAAPPPPTYVEPGPAGRLVYRVEENGDRVPDFSNAGYGGGGAAIPNVPARVLVAPGPGDAGARIQAAIDHVGDLPPDADGFRGAVLVAAGRHAISGLLRMRSGVVLRGTGDGPDGTVLVAAGTGRRPLIRVEGRGTLEIDGDAQPVAVDYVPVGERRLKVERPGAFRVGDSVVVVRPGSAAWIAALGMNRFPLGYEGYLDWRPAAMEIRADRVIAAVDDKSVTLDAPLTTSLDRTLGAATIGRYAWKGRIESVGVENLRCESEYDPRNPRDEEHAWDAVRLDGVQNAWVRRVTAVHFAGSAVRVLDGAKWVTVADCASVEPVSEEGGFRRQAFHTSGQLTLFLRCRSEKGRHDFAVGALTAGPNAFVHCTAVDPLGFSGPVESWASGTLYDNVSVDGSGLSLTNRETDGQGAGWCSANGVLWQCSASTITCRRPPGAHNWAIGCWGQFYGDGEWQAPNEFVKPDSLYRGQLVERLRPQALAALEPGVISTEPGGAKTLDSASPSPREPHPTRPLALENGWLTCEGSLLSGARADTIWWRGSILPTRVGEFGLGVTRFVPGRDGAGFTDDLDELTDAMKRSGKVALEHHWGLWYDRRRDDHQRIRRPDGDVWAPFYEMPWARSGRGTAWDGLSKYDLQRFNPWYFDRLAAFADLCERKGLVLIHQAYFQHNVLEAGAHWADFPWRSANCLQPTGFPEPPPYAGNKRIFMADAFYDLSHPERRALHRAYIRHCLDVLGGRRNVVFALGEEYTGPLEFMQFWLDTVTEWERETGRDVLVGLSATKDVQDAILTDPARAGAVSVVELKYWWYLADGTLYAPEGGRSLAPRQQLREWKGSKKRSAEATARAVHEYRERYPDKAVIVSGAPGDGWSVLAAGGSFPELPRETDGRLLRVVPRLRPRPSEEGQWTLAEPGRHHLGYAVPDRPVRFDLSDERGRFRVNRVDPKTGRVEPTGETLVGGRAVEVAPAASGPTVVWLSSEAETEASPAR